jgi:hypothetical protein
LKHDNNSAIPWLTILKSLPVWAIVCAHFAENWGIYTMLTELPTFLSDVMNYKIEKVNLIKEYTSYFNTGFGQLTKFNRPVSTQLCPT